MKTFLKRDLSPIRLVGVFFVFFFIPPKRKADEISEPCEQLTWDCMGFSDTPIDPLFIARGHAWCAPLLAQIRASVAPRRQHPSPYSFVRLVLFIYLVGERQRAALDAHHRTPWGVDTNKLWCMLVTNYRCWVKVSQRRIGDAEGGEDGW